MTAPDGDRAINTSCEVIKLNMKIALSCVSQLLGICGFYRHKVEHDAEPTLLFCLLFLALWGNRASQFMSGEMVTNTLRHQSLQKQNVRPS